METKTGLYSIGMVTKLTGLTKRQIRYYETKDLISPNRSKGNQRLYSISEVQTLRAIKDLQAKGVTLEGVSRILHANSQIIKGEKREILPQLDYNTLSELSNKKHPLTSVFPVNNQHILNQLLLKSN